MNAIRNAVVIAAAMVALFGSRAQSAEFFTDQGSVWTGGYLTFESVSVRGESVPENLWMVSPVVRYFPVKYFFVSPYFTWEFMNVGSTSSSGSVLIGPEIGFAYGKNIPVIPYVKSGVDYAHSYGSYNYGAGYPEAKYGTDGYQIPISAGVMIPVIDGLGFQVEGGFAYQHQRESGSGITSDQSVISISIGVCGIGKGTALSFLNTF